MVDLLADSHAVLAKAHVQNPAKACPGRQRHATLPQRVIVLLSGMLGRGRGSLEESFVTALPVS